MAPLTFQPMLSSLSRADFKDCQTALLKHGLSLWRGFRVCILDLANNAGSANKSRSPENGTMDLPALAQAVKKRALDLLAAGLAGAAYVRRLSCDSWRSFLLHRQTAPLRMELQNCVRLSPRGCLLSAVAASAVTALAIATRNQSYKVRWLGYAGLTCSAVTFAYFS